MSKIIVLVGSPRKGGNTEMLAKAFADGAGQHHDVELVSVADCRIHPCLGCNRCYSGEGHQCVQQDDMTAIYRKFMEADTVVIVSPVYFYGVSAQLKALIDRLHTPLRNKFRVKRLGLILVGAATLPDLFDPILLQYRMILRFFRLEDIGTVLVSGSKEKGDVLQGDGISRAYELGSSLANAERKEISIRRLSADEIPAALDLAWRTFSEYESPDYAPEGTEEFRKCLQDEAYLSGIEYFGAFDGEKLVGEIGIRPDRMHICFFFVDGRYHRRGIGTQLFRFLRGVYPDRTITLNSSPYGLPFYQALGFIPTETEKSINGIRFTPMKYSGGDDKQ